MGLYWNIYQIVILLNVICKVCVGVLSIHLILLIIKWVKTAYKERNEWETVEEKQTTTEDDNLMRHL